MKQGAFYTQCIMIDIEFIRKHPQKIAEGLTKRNKDTSLLDQFQSIDNQWRAATTAIEAIRANQKKAAQDRNIEQGKQLKEELKKQEEDLQHIEKDRYDILLEFPNIPFDDVPVGKDERENKEVKKVGNIPSFDFPIRDHVELGESLGIIDIKTAAEVAGSRFYYLKGKAALLEVALLHFAFDTLSKEGFEAVIPPVMIRPDVYEKMGRLSTSQREERYFLSKENLYLIGSAEHTLGPLRMDTTLDEHAFPKRYVGFSTAFRQEAGTYGKDTRGILRVHQFDKVELYAFSLPEKSEEEHRFLLSMQEKLFSLLEIPYRVVAICTGDMGPTDARQFDIEAWIPSQNTYREIASCSNTTDYQTRGISAKVKKTDGTIHYAHALNATGIAMGRTIIALLENNQQADGSIRMPKALIPYCGYDTITHE